jgi:hypothetical protein
MGVVRLAMAVAAVAMASPAFATPTAADQAIAPSASSIMIACVEQAIPAAQLDLLANELVNGTLVTSSIDPAPLREALVDRCGIDRGDNQQTVMMSFIYVLLGKGGEVLENRLGLTGERRARFEASVQRVANQIEVNPVTGEFGTAEFGNFLLLDARRALAADGFTANSFAIELSDAALRGYMESLARDRTVRPFLVRLLDAPQ